MTYRTGSCSLLLFFSFFSVFILFVYVCVRVCVCFGVVGFFNVCTAVE